MLYNRMKSETNTDAANGNEQLNSVSCSYSLDTSLNSIQAAQKVSDEIQWFCNQIDQLSVGITAGKLFVVTKSVVLTVKFLLKPHTKNSCKQLSNVFNLDFVYSAVLFFGDNAVSLRNGFSGLFEQQIKFNRI